MAEVGAGGSRHYASCGYNAVGRHGPYALHRVGVERVDVRSGEGNNRAADVRFTEVHTVRLVLLFITTGYAAYEQQFRVVVEAQVVYVVQELIGHTYVVRVFRITAVVGEGMTGLGGSDIVRSHRYEDRELTVCIGENRHTTYETLHAVHTQHRTLYRVVRALVIDCTRHFDRRLVGEVDVVMRVGVVVEIQRTVGRRELMRTERRHDLIVRTCLAIRDAGDNIRTVRLRISRIVRPRRVVDGAEFNLRRNFSGGDFVEIHAVYR